jgi:hypothetical protein
MHGAWSLGHGIVKIVDETGDVRCETKKYFIFHFSRFISHVSLFYISTFLIIEYEPYQQKFL